MRLPTLLLSALSLLSPALASTSSHSSLLARARSSPVQKGLIKLDSAAFDDLTAHPRNYSAVVLLTALSPEFKCTPCKEFDPEWKLVAGNSWRTAEGARGEILWGQLDFKDGQEVYRKLGLASAPNVYFYPATEGPRAKTNFESITYDLNRHGFSAEPLAKWVSENTSVPIGVTRPFPWGKALSTVALGFVSLAVLRVAWPLVVTVFSHKAPWTFVSLAFILIMTSGYMWNQIRNPPYVVPDRDGKISYIAQGYSSQFGMETQIVAAIYALLAFTVTSLTITVPRLPDPMRQRAGVYIWTTALLVTFSILISLFRLKNGGYPFKILF